MISHYLQFAQERYVKEAAKSSHRTDFERDRARILHSSALRRLGAKTQVVSPGSDDFVRTRLTHSLEVAQVGRELAGVLGCDRDVVDAACLSHDLGHPPFGHNGEVALHEAAEHIGGFEGNAQTLRLLARLEAKNFTDQGQSVGLNLTRASLDASCKYPWTLKDAPIEHGKKVSKFGVYEDDLEVFQWMRQGAPKYQACLEAQVMDLADDIAYSVHDIEDAIAAGRIDMSQLACAKTREKIVTFTKQWYVPHSDESQLHKVLDHLETLPYWAKISASNNGLNRQDAADLKNMTSQLIGRFALASLAATLEKYGHRSLIRYDAELIVPYHTVLEISVMKGITTAFVMAHENRQPLYLAQRELLKNLVVALAQEGRSELDAAFAQDYADAKDEASALRVIIDQVASLTDWSARKWHERLYGKDLLAQ